MIREAYEDLSRHKSDLEVNATPCKKHEFDPRTKNYYETECTWKDLNVGDIIIIEDTNFIPADVVMLVSSDKTGSAFMQTSSLDGEKAPKQVMAINEYQEIFNEGNDADQIRYEGVITADPPDANLYSAHGFIENKEISDKKLAWSQKNL